MATVKAPFVPWPWPAERGGELAVPPADIADRAEDPAEVADVNLSEAAPRPTQGFHRPEPVHRGPWLGAPYDTYVRNPLVARTIFLSMTRGPMGGRLAGDEGRALSWAVSG